MSPSTSFLVQMFTCFAWAGVFGIMLWVKMKTPRDYMVALGVFTFIAYANGDAFFSKFRYYHLSKAYKPQLLAEGFTSMLIGFMACTFSDARYAALVPCLMTYALRRKVSGNSLTTMLGLMTGEVRHAQCLLIVIIQLLGSVFGGALHYMLMYSTHAALPIPNTPFPALLASIVVALLPGQAPYAGSLSLLLQPLTLNVVVSRLTVQFSNFGKSMLWATEAAPGGIDLADASFIFPVMVLATALAAGYMKLAKNVGLGLLLSSFVVGLISLNKPTVGALAVAILYEAMPLRSAVTIADLSAGSLACSFPIAIASSAIGAAAAGVLSKPAGMAPIALIPTPDEVTFEAVGSALMAIAVAGNLQHKSLIIGGVIYLGCTQTGRLIPTISELIGSSVQSYVSPDHNGHFDLLISRLVWQFLGGLIGVGSYSFLVGNVQTEAERWAEEKRDRIKQQIHDKDMAADAEEKRKAKEAKIAAKVNKKTQ